MTADSALDHDESAINAAQRSIGHCSRRCDRRNLGPSPSLHLVWMGYPPIHCRRSSGPTSGPWWCRYLHPGCSSALFHRLLGCGYLLCGKPRPEIPDRAPPRVRPLFWRRCRRGDEPGRFTSLCPSRQGSLRTPRPYPRPPGSHGCSRSADFLQCSALRQIENRLVDWPSLSPEICGSQSPPSDHEN